MEKFRMKPVMVRPRMVEAMQYTNNTTIYDLPAEQRGEQLRFCTDGDGEFISIKTPEGTMRADKGDWIIKGAGGEFYSCKPNIFEATHEPA